MRSGVATAAFESSPSGVGEYLVLTDERSVVVVGIQILLVSVMLSLSPLFKLCY